MKQIFTFKKIVLALILIIAGSLYYNHEKIISAVFVHYLKSASHQQFNGDFTAEEAYVKEGVLYLKQPKIHKSGIEPAGGFAEEMRVKYAFHPFKFTVDLHIHVESPTLYLNEEAPSLDHFFSDVAHQSNLPFLNIDVTLNHGQAHLLSQNGPSRLIQFEMDGHYSKEGHYHGNLSVNIDEAATKNKTLKITALKPVHQPLEVTCAFDQMDCVSLFRIGKILYPSLNTWSIYGGILEGKLTFTFQDDLIPQCQGEASVYGLAIANPLLRISGDLQEAKLVLQNNPNTPDKSASWMQAAKMIGSFEIIRPGSLTFYRFGRPFWEMSQLGGMIDLSEQGVKIAFKGKCSHRQQTFDITLGGGGRYIDDLQSSCDLSLKLLSPDKEETEVRFIARQLGSLCDCAEVLLKNVTQDEFSLIQEPLAGYYPNLGKMHVHSGSLDASVIAYLKDYRVTDIKIDNITGRQLEFYVPPYDLAGKIDHVEGALTVSCIPKNILETLNADFTIHNGQLKLDAGGEKLCCFKEINTQIGVRKGVIQRSVLEGEFAGLYGSVEVDYSDPAKLMKLSFNGNAKSLKHLLPKTIFERIGENLDSDQIAITAYVSRQEEDLKFQGELAIFQQAISKRDHVQFGFDFYSRLPTQRGDVAGIVIKNGWVSSKDLSTYLNFGLTDISLDTGKIHFSNFELNYQEMFLAGEVLLNYSEFSKGILDVYIQANTLKGKLTQLTQTLAKQIVDSIPLDGEISLKKDGAILGLHFGPNKCDVDLLISGAMSEGYTTNHQDYAIKDFSFDFDFDSSKDSLEITQIQGTATLGHDIHREEYLIAGEYINFRDFKNLHGDFDVWVGNKSRDMIRIVGDIVGDSQDPSTTHVVLNKELTHLSQVHPTAFALKIKNLTEIENFSIDFDFKLDHLFRDLDQILQSGIFINPKFAKYFNDIKKTEGIFTANLSFENTDGSFAFHIKGDDVSFGDKSFKTFQLDGKNKDGTWIIDQLQMDQYSIAADIIKKQNHWILNFLGIQCGDSLLVGLEGSYDTENYTLDAKINLLEIDMESLNEWAFLADFVNFYQPNGLIKSTGEVHIEKEKNKQRWNVDALLVTSLKSFGMKGIQFKDADNISCHIDSKRGITLRNIETALLTRKEKELRGLASLEKVDYDFVNGTFSYEGLDFNVPCESLAWLVENLQQLFPDTITPNTAYTIQNLKKQGNLEGTLSWSLSSKGKFATLLLKEGTYHFAGVDHTVNNFVMKSDPFEICLLTQYHYNQHVFWLQGVTTAPLYNKGICILSDNHPDQLIHVKDRKPLLLECEIDPICGFQVHSAQGELSGMSFNLHKNPSMQKIPQKIHLVGDITTHIGASKFLFSKEISDKIEYWSLGKGYLLSGNWTYQKETSHDKERGVHFDGKLHGNDFEIKGYVFSKIHANIDYSPSKVHITQVIGQDRSGHLSIGDISLAKDYSNNWTVKVPEILVSNFKPGLLKEPGNISLGKPRPLNIKKIEVYSLEGSLGDLSTLKGNGKLYFANPTRKAIHNTILAIPAEILARIGLDLGLLQPVAGTIVYTIEDSKIRLKRFKDVYSDGKLSKFYIPSSSTDSYVDFSGNLNLQVKMKQYNLLLKLAELFTVSIQGNLQKPTFSLYKSYDRY